MGDDITKEVLDLIEKQPSTFAQLCAARRTKMDDPQWRKIDGGKIIEAQMHERFADLRHRGEWYRCGDALMTFIASLSEQPTVSV